MKLGSIDLLQIKSVRTMSDILVSLLIEGLEMKSNFEIECSNKEECYNFVTAINYYIAICKNAARKV